ncbi:MAG: YjgP/YjgQ family permease [Pedosphaera sp.]|nr:YjgP/YjgQ family permease [Pedosphaera sp.]
MQTLTQYLLRQLLATFGLCLVVFTLLLLLGNVLKEVLDLLTSQLASPAVAMRAILLLLPFVIAFALPIALLAAVLLTFGRLSADQEITAMRANGISLVQIAFPVVAISLLLSGIGAWFNLEIAPRCRQAFKGLQYQMLRDQSAVRLLRPRSYTQIGDLDIYVGGTSGNHLTDVLLYQYTNQVKILECRAERARLETNELGFPVRLVLEKVDALQKYGDTWNPGSSEVFPVDLPSRGMKTQAWEFNEMTFQQLLVAKAALEERGAGVTPIQVQLHRQLAFSLAPVGFALVGIPLAIRAHRRETNIGIVIALFLVLIYYSFIILGQSLETRSSCRPHWIVWAPNFLFQAIGSILLWRADRRG